MPLVTAPESSESSESVSAPASVDAMVNTGIDPLISGGPVDPFGNELAEIDSLIQSSEEFIINPLTLEEVEEYFRSTE